MSYLFDLLQKKGTMRESKKKIISFYICLTKLKTTFSVSFLPFQFLCPLPTIVYHIPGIYPSSFTLSLLLTFLIGICPPPGPTPLPLSFLSHVDINSNNHRTTLHRSQEQTETEMRRKFKILRLRTLFSTTSS